MEQKTKARILIFSLTYFPFVGGAEVALKEITERIKDFDFDLVTAKFSKKLPSEERVGRLNVYRIGRGSRLDKYLYPWRAFLLSRRLHKTHNYRLIWAMMANWAGLSALIFKVFNPQVKYLLTLQEGDSVAFLRARTWFWRSLYAQIYKQADHIQVISRWLGKRARDYGYRGQLSLIPNGVDLEKINHKLGARHYELKNKLGIREYNKVVFTSSRLVKKNDLATLIRAVEYLIVHFKLALTLVIVGSGKLENKLKKLAGELKIEQRVIFIGWVDFERVFDYYALADVFARPSLSEGQGVSFIEAMAMGLPIVATPVGGIPDFLIDGETGLFCQISDPVDLAEKIKLLLTDSELYAKIQRNAFALVRQKYDWNIIARRMNNLFVKI